MLVRAQTITICLCWLLQIFNNADFVNGVEFECYEPLCNQGTAFLSSVLGDVGLDFYLPVQFFYANEVTSNPILSVCALLMQKESKIPFLRTPVKVCTNDVDNVHLHLDLSHMGQENDVSKIQVMLRSTLVEVEPLYIFTNGTSEVGQKVDFFIMLLSDYDERAASTMEVNQLSTVQVNSPHYGSVSANSFHMFYETSVVTRESCTSIQLYVDDMLDTRLSTSTSHVSASGDTDPSTGKPLGDGSIEPGSWFLTVLPLLSMEAIQNGTMALPSFGYIEFVLEQQQLISERVFSILPQRKPQNKILVNGIEPQQKKVIHEPEAETETEAYHGSTAKKNTNICIWASNKSDGQKSIYLQQMQDLPSSFSFVYFMSSPSPLTTEVPVPFEGHAEHQGRMEMDTSNMNDFEKKLYQLSYSRDIDRPSVQVVPSPTLSLVIQSKKWSERILNNEGTVLHENSSKDEVLRFMAERFYAANGTIDEILPKWVREPYVAVRDAMLRYDCHVSVHGNVRGHHQIFLLPVQHEV